MDEESKKVASAGSTKVDTLSTSQEEADTKVFLHLNMEQLEGCHNVVITLEDTDVFIIAAYVASVSNIAIY